MGPHPHGVDRHIPPIIEVENHDLQKRVTRPIPAEIEHLVYALIVVFIQNSERMRDRVLDIFVIDPMLAGRSMDVHSIIVLRNMQPSARVDQAILTKLHLEQAARVSR